MFKSFIQIIIDALFPIQNTDRILFSYTKEQIFEKLPKASQTPIPDTYSIFYYKNKLVTRLIWNIKYKKNMRAVEIGGYALYKRINDQFPLLRSSQARSYEGQAMINNPSFAKATKGEQILLIPIPISQKRKKERGFNQCELLIDEILKLDKTDKLITQKDLLIRIVHKDRQTLKNREERLEDAKNIFSIEKENYPLFKKNYTDLNFNLKNIPVIIIDDVITTGSTMKEAMETLRLAGFGNVIGISLAH